MNITEKLLEARKLIKGTKIKKEGTNTYSKYDYFTPSQVSELVNTVCQELKILVIFSLQKGEHGLYGHLKINDIESDTFIETFMYTEKPVITATNETQQMGGCETYTKRYMLMSAFDITDNNLDFDSQDNRDMPTSSNNDIALNIRLCGTMQELEEVWKSIPKEDQSKYNSLVTIRKKEISINK